MRCIRHGCTRVRVFGGLSIIKNYNLFRTVITKITTDFILLLVPNYPISNPLSNGPKSLLLQHLCLIILVILYFSKIPLSPMPLQTSLTLTTITVHGEKNMQQNLKLLFLQFNSGCIIQDNVIMPNYNRYPDGLGSKPSYVAILAVDLSSNDSFN